VSVDGVPGRWVVDPAYLDSEEVPVPDRTTLLSPFDRLIHDRERTEALFTFHYRLEIYVPKERRQHGYFVMPVLHGDRLVGRVDPEFDRRRRLLYVHAVHVEPDAPVETGERVAGALQNLAAWLGATDVQEAVDAPE
jgi:uncharacterized protein YcaQ